MSLKEEIINRLIDVEGGHSDHPDDSGGATKYGITEMEARANHYHGKMEDLTRDFAFEIYVNRYWSPLKGDQLMQISERVTEEVFDTAVNIGQGRAIKFLQESLNVLNKHGELYDELKVDCAIGKRTLAALKTYLENREEDVLLKALNCLQGAFYIELAKKRQKDETFIYGWLKNRVQL